MRTMRRVFPAGRLQLQEELQQKEYHRIVMILIVRILRGIVVSTTLKVLFADKAQPTQLSLTAHTDENTGLPLLAIRHCDPLRTQIQCAKWQVARGCWSSKALSCPCQRFIHVNHTCIALRVVLSGACKAC